MIFNEIGNKTSPTIILLHGGGLSDWSWQNAVKMLESDYHIVTPIIDGHGEAGKETFVSIEHSAVELIEYIEKQFDGKVFAIGGLSIGRFAAVLIILICARSGEPGGAIAGITAGVAIALADPRFP